MTVRCTFFEDFWFRGVAVVCDSPYLALHRRGGDAWLGLGPGFWTAGLGKFPWVCGSDRGFWARRMAGSGVLRIGSLRDAAVFVSGD